VDHSWQVVEILVIGMYVTRTGKTSPGEFPEGRGLILGSGVSTLTDKL
jgi:hypothetical protein